MYSIVLLLKALAVHLKNNLLIPPPSPASLILLNSLILTPNCHFVVSPVGVIDIALYKGGLPHRGVANDDDLEQDFCHGLVFHSIRVTLDTALSHMCTRSA